MNKQDLEVVQRLRNKLQDTFIAMQQLDETIIHVKSISDQDRAKLKVDMMQAQTEFADLQEVLEELGEMPLEVSTDVKDIIADIASKKD